MDDRNDPLAEKKARLAKLLEIDKKAKSTPPPAEPDLSLEEFVKLFWPIIEPAVPLVWGWYLTAICEHLEAVTDGRIRNLIINIPPRMSKSTIVAIMWPCWVWTFKPHIRWLFSSYGADISERDSLRCKRLIRSAEYQSRFGRRFQIQKDKDTVQKFETTRAGYRIATSVDGVATGEGGDVVVCLPYNTAIETSRGSMAIGDVVEGQLDVGILGPSGTYQRVSAYEKNPGRALLRFDLEDGTSFSCTDNHPVFVDGHGYVPAKDVINCDYGSIYLRRLRSIVQSRPWPHGSVKDGQVLLQEMLCGVREGTEQPQIQWRHGNADMSELSDGIPVEAFRSQAANILLSQMPERSRSRAAKAAVPGMPSGLCPKGLSSAFLQPYLRQSGSQQDDSRQRQRSFQERQVVAPLRARLYEGAYPVDCQAGRSCLCPLRQSGEAPGSSHRRLEDESRPDQSRYGLPLVSSAGSHKIGCESGLDEPVRLVSISRCPAPDAVYNLRVEPDHAYYANGVLLHNCDDPLKASDGNSDTKRNYANRWWAETMSSRLNNQETGARVIIMQRVHENDLTGYVLENSSGYEWLSLPMEYEIPRDDKGNILPKHRTCLGFEDPRNEEGELLCPQRFSPDIITFMKANTTEYAWAGQYQQRPAPRGGGMFRVDKLEIVPQIPRDAKLIRVRSWDRAATQGGGAYTAGVRMCLDVATNTLYIDDVHRGQWGTDVREAETLRVAREDGVNCYIVIEQEPGSAGVDSVRATTKMLIGFRVFIDKVSGDKTLRAEPLATQVSIENVKLVAGDWNTPFIKELETFPNSKYKDQVDSASLGFNWLARARTTPREPVSTPVPERFRVR